MANYMTEFSPNNDTNVYQVKDEEASPISLLKDTVGWTGKNLLKPTNSKGTSSTGITYIIDENGADLNGTATAGFNVLYGTIKLPAGQYIYTDGVETTDNTYFMNIAPNPASGSGNLNINSKPYSFTVNSETEFTFTIYVRNGQTLSHLKFYPMLRDASILDDTYEPYHPSVEQTLRDAEVIEGKNKANFVNGKGISNPGGEVVDEATRCATVNPTPIISGKSYKFVASGDTNAIVAVWNGNTLVRRTAGLTSGSIIDVSGGDRFYTCAYVGGSTATIESVKPMVVYADETDLSYEPFYCYFPLKDSKFDRAEQRVLGAKNLLDKSVAVGITADVAVTQTSNGVRGVVASSSTWKSVSLVIPNPSKNTNLILTDYANITSGRSIQKVEGTDNKTTFTTIKESDTGITTSANQSLAFNSGSYNYLRIQLYVTGGSGYEIGDITFENIMLRLASDPDNTYVPYAMTNRELTVSIGKGLVFKGSIPSGADLNNYTQTGIYDIAGTSPTHLPSGSSGYVPLFVIGNEQGRGNTKQIIVSRANELYIRNINAGESWGDWYKFAGTVVS